MPALIDLLGGVVDVTFDTFIRQQVERYGKLVREVGIKPE